MPKLLRKTRVELNNAVFSLPDIVAKAEGFFEQEGLEVELVVPEKRKAMLAASGTRASEPTAIQSFLWHEG
ncbi:MAG: ABC transporter substrate-binding protein, partial [Burkholderiales bacterium]